MNPPSTPSPARRQQLLRLALHSALILFFEMLLIRWIGTEVRVFAYLQNGVLVAVFLGLGLGCRNAREPVRLLPALLVLLPIGFIVADPFDASLGEMITQGLAAFGDSGVWHLQGTGSTGAAYVVRLLLFVCALSLTVVLLAACTYAVYPLGQWLGRWMDEYPTPISAYTVNIAGSLAGIALFDAATVLRTPPWTWLVVVTSGFLLLARLSDDGRTARALVVALAVILPLFGLTPSAHPTTWSPYQKLMLEPLEVYDGGRRTTCGEKIVVNNTGYQLLLDLDAARMAARPDTYPPAEIRTSHYVLPYELIGSRERVLVVGAGAGNDVAAALRAGARTVKAVEIDPVILEWGRERHPNAPYRSDRVTVSVDDARAFFRRDEGPYDLIWFGLLDSHTTPSAYTNVRLDHFVYTRESFADMKQLLAPAGVVVLFFEPQTRWIADRLFLLLRDTFDTDPVALDIRSSTACLGWGGLMLLGGRPDVLAPIRVRAEADPDVRARLQAPDSWPRAATVTSDDWPYLYLARPGLPAYHLFVGLTCLAIGLGLRRRLFRPGEDLNPTMLLLGAGFMLLEVSSVSRAALLYGTTWTVNAYVVGGVLAMILLANLVAARVAFDPRGWPFVGLVLSLLAVGLVPTASLASLSTPARIVVGGMFLSLPIFFSGLVFVVLWAAAARKDLALGSNLRGSLLGGIASMLSMAVGFRALTLLTVGIYLAVLPLLRRS